MSISFFCIATEPIKNMYPIKESINTDIGSIMPKFQYNEYVEIPITNK